MGTVVAEVNCASSRDLARFNDVFTACKVGCGKVMFSQVCVCSQGGWVSLVPCPFWGVGRGGYVQDGVGTHPSPPIHGILRDMVNKRVVLECFLVELKVVKYYSCCNRDWHLTSRLPILWLQIFPMLYAFVGRGEGGKCPCFTDALTFLPSAK